MIYVSNWHDFTGIVFLLFVVLCFQQDHNTCTLIYMQIKRISYVYASVWPPDLGTGLVYMMTSSNGNIFRVTGPLCGEFTGPGEFTAQRPVTRGFDVSFICAWINNWVNNRGAGDLRRHRGHYDVHVMLQGYLAGIDITMMAHERQTVSNQWLIDCWFNKLYWC